MCTSPIRPHLFFGSGRLLIDWCPLLSHHYHCCYLARRHAHGYLSLRINLPKKIAIGGDKMIGTYVPKTLSQSKNHKWERSFCR